MGGAVADEHMEIGELEVFLTLADELHFGRTAERLRFSQPRVSQLVRSLERRVGGRLFERTSRRVALTPLGTRLLEGARPAFDRLRQTLVGVRAFAQGLRVGFLGSYGSTLDEALAAFRARHPDCAVTMVQLTWTDVFGPLRRSEVDLQACLLPVEQDDLTVGPIVAESPRLIAISRAHPLAQRPVITIEDLADLEVIQPAETVPEELKRTFWPPAHTPAGRPIPRATVAHTEQEMLSTAAHGSGVFITTTAMPRHFTHPEVAFIPFTGMPPARVALVWRRDNDKHKVLELANLAG
jgi:DNA-binding transcriptional LysR family regulator